MNNNFQQISSLNAQLRNISKLFLENERAIQKFDEKTKIKWVKKSEICLITHIALKAMNEYLWYLNSASSHHMLGEQVTI